ncbi:MAG: K(+)-transporting ATPase subunit F [Actinomycetota bacterium]
MSVVDVIELILAVGLLGYLTYVLIHPEKF